MPAYQQNVEQLHRTTYAANVGMAAQQLSNVLEGSVTVVPASGEATRVSELFGSLEYMRGEARARRNPENPASASSRWVVYDPENEVESGQYIDREDKFKATQDPTSSIVRVHTAAVKRGIQDNILGVEKAAGSPSFRVTRGGIYGVAREGKTPGVSAPLPVSQYLTADSAGLTLDKLIATTEMLNLADFGIDADLDPLYALISPKQKSDLLRIAAAPTAGNINAFDVRALESGKPTMLMGVNWIMTNRVPKDANGRRMVAVYSKSNIIVGEYWGLQGDMWNDSHAKNKPYCHATAMHDCVRAQDAGVVIIPCTEI